MRFMTRSRRQRRLRRSRRTREKALKLKSRWSGSRTRCAIVTFLIVWRCFRMRTRSPWRAGTAHSWFISITNSLSVPPWALGGSGFDLTRGWLKKRPLMPEGRSLQGPPRLRLNDRSLGQTGIAEGLPLPGRGRRRPSARLGCNWYSRPSPKSRSFDMICGALLQAPIWMPPRKSRDFLQPWGTCQHRS